MKRYYLDPGKSAADLQAYMSQFEVPESGISADTGQSDLRVFVIDFDPATMYPQKTESDVLEFLDSSAEALGFIKPTDPAAIPTKPLVLRQNPPAAQLTSAGSAIANASGWQTVIEQEITVGAGAKVEIDWWIFGNMLALTLGGQVRVVVNGGNYTDHVVQAALDLPLVVTGAHLSGPALFTPDAADEYTLSLQARATISAGTFTPQAGCALRLREFGSSL